MHQKDEQSMALMKTLEKGLLVIFCVMLYVVSYFVLQINMGISCNDRLSKDHWSGDGRSKQKN